jgi:multiple sugar transport system permease protein
MLAVTAYPIGYALWLSLQRYDLRFPGEARFVGLSNYRDVLTSPLWWQDLATTGLVTALSVAIELILGMGLALVMHRAIFGRRTVRTSILVPYGIITVVAALAWRFAFDPTTGFVNELLNTDRSWFSGRPSSLIVIVLSEAWKTTPFMALLLLAGLTLVPEELLRAGRVDGATAVQRFFKISLPLMKPAILVALLFRTLDAFRIFDTVFVQTAGANATETVSILGYKQLINRLNLGIGSAVSVLIFVCVLAIAFLFVKGFGASLAAQRGAR